MLTIPKKIIPLIFNNYVIKLMSFFKPDGIWSLLFHMDAFDWL